MSVTENQPAPSVPSRRLRWLITLGAVAVLIAVASRARFTTDLRATLPSHDVELNRILAFWEGLGSTQLMAIEGWAEPGGAATLDGVRSELIKIGGALQGVGAAPLPQPGPESVARLVDVIESHLPVLVTAPQLDELAKRLEPAALRDYLRVLKERASRPEDQFTATAVRLDVMAVGGALMQTATESFAGLHLDQGLVGNADGLHLLLPLTVDFDPKEVGRCAALMGAIDAEVAQARAQGVHLEAIGSYRHFNDNMANLHADIFSTIPLGIVLIALVLYSLARSWGGVAAMYLPALLALAGAMAAAALTGGAVALPLIGFAASMLGIAVDYGIQMTTALRAGDCRHVWRPLTRSVLISVCAFAALIPSPVPALSQLGVMVAGGLLTAYASARWLLPAVVSPSPRVDPWGRLTTPLLAWCEAEPLKRLALVALITAALVPGLFRLAVLSDIQRMDGSKAPTRAALEGFLSRWGSLEATNYVVANATDLDRALESAANARACLNLPPSRLERLLPSRAEQQRRLEAWNRFWDQRGETFRADFAAACAEVKLRPAAFAASLERYRPVAAGMTIDLDEWQATPLEMALSTSVKRTDGGWQVASPIEGLRGPESQALSQRGKEQCIAPAWIASRFLLAHRLVTVFGADLAWRGLVLAIAIVIAVTVLVRRTRLGLAMLLPPAVALVWTFGLLGYLDVELTPFTVLVAAFVGGIGIDCAIFLAEGDSRQRLISPVMACIATTIAGTGSLLIAHHPLLAGVGLTLTIGMVSCLVTCLLLTPALAGKGAFGGRREDAIARGNTGP